MKRSQTVQKQKLLLRKELRERLSEMSPAERSQKSENILNQLLTHSRFLKARSIFCYVALKNEVETRPILEEALKKTKKLYVPRVDPRERQIQMIEISNLTKLKPGSYGILEPSFDAAFVGKPENLDLAVVPGIGFDLGGGRLGRGKGYYDRFLLEAKKAYKIGLAFESQMVEQIPRAENDALVNEVLVS